MVARNVGRGRDQGRAEIGRRERLVARHRGRRGDHRIELNTVAGVVADYIGRGSDQSW